MAGFQVLESSSKRLGQVYKQLDKVGRGALRRELRSGLNAVSRGARRQIRDAERDALPSGMDASYSKVPAQSLSISGRGVNLRWKHARKDSDMRALDRGVLRHPVYGNRNVWVTQRIPKGMWSNAVAKVGPEVVADTEKVLVRAVERLVK